MATLDNNFKDLFFKIESLEDNNYRTVEEVKEFNNISYMLIAKSERVKTMKYLVFMYDKNSPLVSQYNEVRSRKQKALELSNVVKSEDPYLYEKLMLFEDSDLIQIAAQMLRKQNDSIFSMLVSQEIFFDECLKKVLQPLEIEDDKKGLEALEKKAKISEAMEKVADRIEKYKSKFFRNDDDLEKKIRNVVAFTPESIAQY
jgi:hypothetical protein